MLNWAEFESMVTDGMAPQGRDIHVYVGSQGADLISHSFAVNNSVGFVEWMMEKKKITPDVGQNLINMLQSEDRENFNLAILAIEQLKK